MSTPSHQWTHALSLRSCCIRRPCSLRCAHVSRHHWATLINVTHYAQPLNHLAALAHSRPSAILYRVITALASVAVRQAPREHGSSIIFRLRTRSTGAASSAVQQHWTRYVQQVNIGSTNISSPLFYSLALRFPSVCLSVTTTIINH